MTAMNVYSSLTREVFVESGLGPFRNSRLARATGLRQMFVPPVAAQAAGRMTGKASPKRGGWHRAIVREPGLFTGLVRFAGGSKLGSPTQSGKRVRSEFAARSIQCRASGHPYTARTALRFADRLVVSENTGGRGRAAGFERSSGGCRLLHASVAFWSVPLPAPEVGRRHHLRTGTQLRVPSIPAVLRKRTSLLRAGLLMCLLSDVAVTCISSFARSMSRTGRRTDPQLRPEATLPFARISASCG